MLEEDAGEETEMKVHSQKSFPNQLKLLLQTYSYSLVKTSQDDASESLFHAATKYQLQPFADTRQIVVFKCPIYY